MSDETFRQTPSSLDPEVFKLGSLALDVWHALSPAQKVEFVTHVSPRLVDELFIDGSSPQELMDLSNAFDRAGRDLHRRASTITSSSAAVQEQPEYREY